MDSQVMRNFKFLFGALGFEPIKGKSKLSKCLICFHVVVAIAQMVVIMKYRDIILYTYDRIGKFCDYLKLFSSFCSYYAAIYVSWSHSNCYDEIATEVESLKTLMEKLRINVDTVDRRFIRSFRKKFMLIMALQVFGTVLQAISKNSERQSMRFIFAFTFPVTFAILKHFHAIFYIDMVNNYILVLNDQLTDVKDLIFLNEVKLRSKNYKKFLLKKLRLCRNFYRILLNINSLQNKCMGMFFLINHVYFHIYFLSSHYWITFRLFNTEFDSLTFTSSVISILTKYLAVITMSNACENTEELIKHSACNLHEIIYSKQWENVCCNELIESFSLEMLDERRMRISALGYFDINYGSFAKMVSSITWSVSLFIQLSPKYKNEFEFN